MISEQGYRIRILKELYKMKKQKLITEMMALRTNFMVKAPRQIIKTHRLKIISKRSQLYQQLKDKTNRKFIV